MSFDGGHDPARASHAALRQIRQELIRYPAIKTVQGHPHDTLFTEIRADVDPSLVGMDAPSGTLTVRWFVGEPDDPRRFAFHYADETGFDCGWHHHEQDHIDGWGHYQERESEADEYSYDPFQFESEEPSRIVWEIVAELEDIFETR